MLQDAVPTVIVLVEALPIVQCVILKQEIVLVNMSLVVRKPVFGVSDKVRHTPGNTAIDS